MIHSKKTHTFVLRPAHDRLLRGSDAVPVGIYHLQLTTPEQLCRLHYSMGSLTAVKARLKELVDSGYVLADAIPTRRGKSPYYYTLGPQGVRYLSELGYTIRDSFRPSTEVDKSYLHIRHTLDLNDVLVAAALVTRVDSRYHLEELTHERTLKRHPIVMQAPYHGRQMTFRLIPDGIVVFRLILPDRQPKMTVFLEYDRDSEGQDKFRRRIRSYITLLATQAYRERVDAKRIVVAFSTFAGQEHMHEMRRWTEEELHSTSEPWEVGAAFAFSHLPKAPTPEQAWFEPRWHLAYSSYQQADALLDR
jgi:hypothetical protein